MKFQHKTLVFLIITIAKCVQMVNSDDAATNTTTTTTTAIERDAEVLRKCLYEVGAKDVLGELQKLTRYSKWTTEEIPCFTRCIASAKGWFNADENSWHKQQITDELGADMYNYCRYELDRVNDDGCEFAYSGLRCLKQAELYTLETYTHILSCANELNATMETLQKYALFPQQEVVPCLFQCFAQKMHFYTPTYEWNFENWVKAFGPMKQDRAASEVCKASAAVVAQQDQQCAWMYEEYNCLERLNYNTDGAVVPALEATTLSIIAAKAKVDAAGATTEEPTHATNATAKVSATAKPASNATNVATTINPASGATKPTT